MTDYRNKTKMSSDGVEETTQHETNPKDAMVSSEEASEEDLAKAAEVAPLLSYREAAKARGMNYTVTDVPPLGLSMILGLQHYLTMLGATVLIPLLLCPAMGASGQQTADVISSIFFVSGINTLIQTSIGDRYVMKY